MRVPLWVTPRYFEEDTLSIGCPSTEYLVFLGLRFFVGGLSLRGRLVFSHKWVKIHLQQDEVELEISLQNVELENCFLSHHIHDIGNLSV